MSFRKLQNLLVFLLLFSSLWFLDGGSVYSSEFASDNYQLLDSTMNSGGYGTSDSFQLSGVISQVANGLGSSASSFSENAGFLSFPTVTNPVLTATPGNGQVSLSWTSATGYLGWTTSGYNIGKSNTSGGPYTYTSLANVTSSVIGSLTNSTPYYFIVLAKDAFGNIIATSSEVVATPVAASTPSGGGGGGGGGGSDRESSGTKVVFTGRAYPRSEITLLKDAQVVAATTADINASFQITVSDIAGGNYIFSVYSEDNKGVRSSLLSFPVSVTSGVTTNINNIFIAPTIAVDKSEVKKGDNIVIFGQSMSHSDIVISVHSDEEFFSKTVSDKDGVYLYNFDTSFLEFGSHMAKSKASIDNRLISSYSNSVGFTVGLKNVIAPVASKCPNRADLNNDCRVNLIDFSIAAYWYKRPLNVDFGVREKRKLNGDGKVDLVDFSIMAYHWTG